MLFSSSHLAASMALAMLLVNGGTAVPFDNEAVAGAPVLAESDDVDIEARSTAALSTYQQAILDHHNSHRANHSAPALKWGSAMATNAERWAKQCSFTHNTDNTVNKAHFGQNLLVGISSSTIGPGVSDYWYNNEMPYFHWYGQANPDFSTFEDYGHFSQMVWKNSKTVGCYTADCSAHGVSGVGSGIAPYLTVCNYWPPGTRELFFFVAKS